MERLTDSEEIETARQCIMKHLAARGEWLCTQLAAHDTKNTSKITNPKTFSIHESACEIRLNHGCLFLHLWTDRGESVWRVLAWELCDEKLRIEGARRMGAERAVFEFTPRASVHDTRAEMRAARFARCIELARIAREMWAQNMQTNAQIERANLSTGARRNEPGRYARILLKRSENRATKFVAATGAVVELKTSDIESFLASALLWFARLGEKIEAKKSRVEVAALWLIVTKGLAEACAARVALLRANLRRVVSICALDEEKKTLEFTRVPEFGELLQATNNAPRLVYSSRADFSDTAVRLRALAPEAIDIVRARHGETLRFHGLPFARVRRVAGVEKVWFGVGASKRALDENNWTDLVKLLDDLKEYRRANEVAQKTEQMARETDGEIDLIAPSQHQNMSFDFQAESDNFQNKSMDSQNESDKSDSPHSREFSIVAQNHHTLYSSAPEAWLEAILRRDITRLDPGLRLAPLHAQFRAGVETAKRGARPVDLLALRQDGRLVVIELKVSEDVTLPLQGADYWHRIELQRRAGNITRARIFDAAEILDAPPLVYLVAPMLRFHRAFETLANFISPEIEIYRFDINEDWRAGVRVMRRMRVS